MLPVFNCCHLNTFMVSDCCMQLFATSCNSSRPAICNIPLASTPGPSYEQPLKVAAPHNVDDRYWVTFLSLKNRLYYYNIIIIIISATCVNNMTKVRSRELVSIGLCMHPAACVVNLVKLFIETYPDVSAIARCIHSGI